MVVWEYLRTRENICETKKRNVKQTERKKHFLNGFGKTKRKRIYFLKRQKRNKKIQGYEMERNEIFEIQNETKRKN
jgi:hypothetical protein